MYYASFGMLAIVLHFIINYGLITADRLSLNVTQKRYREYLSSVAVYYVSDIIWGFLYELRIVPLVYTDTIVYFIMVGLSVFLWTRFVVSYLNRDNFFSSFLIVSGRVIFFAELLMLLVNFVIPVFFYFDDDGVYQPGKARYVLLGIQIVLFTLTFIYSLVIAFRSTESAALHHRTIGISGVMMTVFIILQTIYPLLPFYAIGILVATSLIRTFVLEEHIDEQYNRLAAVRREALTDPLTGIRNIQAYTEEAADIDLRIRKGECDEFGVAVFDLNNLKEINDSFGHEMGNKYIKYACSMICNQFKRSPVFRIGGDEFVVILEGDDYYNREELMTVFDSLAERNQRIGQVVVSGGYSVFDPLADKNYQTVFDRADLKMYERKNELKKIQRKVK